MILYDLIHSLSTEDYEKFKSYIRRKNKRTDTKNLALLKLLRQSQLPANIDHILYGKASKNAYHALCKRLHDNLIDFIASRSLETETTEEFEVLKLILTARILYEQEIHKAAQKTLQKAATLAKTHDLYSMLTEIYHTQIQYTHLHPEINLEILIQDFQINQKLHQHQENLNLAYAYIKNKISQTNNIVTVDVNQLLSDAFQKFNITIDTSLTFKSLYQLLEIINTVARLENNYVDALPFFERVYHKINLKKTLSNKHLYYHIHLLYFMANAYFRNRQFERATGYLDTMKSHMLSERGKYELRFRESELLLRTLILNYTGHGLDAITLLEKHFESSQQKNKTQNPDLILVLCICLTQQERHKQAHSALNKLRHSTTWYIAKMGEDWVIKHDLLELITHIELEHIDLVASLLKRFKRKYKHVIQHENRLQDFLKTLEIIYKYPEEIKSIRFRESVKRLFTSKDKAKEDIFMLSYFAWIHSKTTQKSLYQTTLDLL
ncbi:hypothetical protein GCM10011344_20170 [Dokdonia pacifica]|uniref:Tetratricopeptide repeat-containing protein n=1 Tax=Dokdonia pacifica TaxID=1627892 RepID=A0A238VP39_9FLAO|nr:hypothetical protein [Dokdonia pacifica]GGG19452.1 hypothetical protein GCM10011344_20170 [Dokdonia pacifica]SNR35951.1 hypothetical protein SAMN06265376_101116 [Dokdonia pacifica]